MDCVKEKMCVKVCLRLCVFLKKIGSIHLKTVLVEKQFNCTHLIQESEHLSISE